MKKNILRVVALLLVVCVFASFPLKAKATEVAAYAALSVGAQNLIAGLFNACGLGPGEDPQPFFDAVNQCISDLHLGETIMGVSWVFSGFNRFAVPVTLAEQVRDWLWDSGTITESVPGSVGHSISCVYKDEEYSHSSDGLIGYFFIDLGYPLSSGSIQHSYRFLILSDYKSCINELHAPSSSGRITFDQNSAGQYYSIISTTSTTGEFSGTFSGVTDLGSYVFSSSDELRAWWNNFLWLIPAASDGFISGDIADRMKTLSEGYPAWGEGIFSVDSAIVDSDEEEPIPYIPVGVGATLEESAAQTQEQAQSGVSTVDVTVEIPDDTVAGTKLGAFLDSLKSVLSWDKLQTRLQSILDAVKSIPEVISKLPETIAEKWTGFWTSVTTFLSDILSSIRSIPQAIANTFTDFWTTVTTWLESLYTGVISIPQTIGEILTNIFVPSTDYVSVKVEALTAEFGFVHGIIDTVVGLRDAISGSSGPPVIYVDLGRAGGSTNYGGKVLLTDFAWYEEYKPTVDAFLSAALWAFFSWRVFIRLPGLISGDSGVVGSIVKRSREE